MSTMVEQSTDRIAKALGRVPSGCSILTARAGVRRMGMLASWVQQAGFEPPMISVAVKKGRPIVPLIDDSGAFVVNVLGEDPGAALKHFGKGFAPDEDAFDGIAAMDVAGGVAIEDRIAMMTADMHGKYDAGDHWLYVGAVTHAEIAELLPPYVRVRNSGLTY